MIEYLNQLEEKITRLSGLYASAREERERLEKENSELKRKFEELDVENKRLKDTQDQVREKVNTLLKRMEGLGE